MTSRSLFLKHGFIFNNAPLKNGLGRFVPQLQRITFKFCKEAADSVGVRHFIENNVVQFAKENPHVVIYLKPRRFRRPQLVAEYLNGEKQYHMLKDTPREGVCDIVNAVQHHSGKEFQIQEKYHYTDNLSVQGTWNPFTHTDPQTATAQFPHPDLSKPYFVPKTATEKLQELFKTQGQSSL